MSDEKIKISQLPLVSSYVNLYTIGTDNSLNSVKVPLYILSQIGDLSALTTSDKSSIVAAINEAVSEIQQGGGGAGFSQVAVILEDNTPGTPTAEASIVNDTLTLTFHHLKGEKGDSAEDLDNLVYIGIDEGPISLPLPTYEETTNKVTSINAQSTDTQYPSAKAVFTLIEGLNIPTTYAGSPTAGGFANKAVAIPFGHVDSDSTSTNIKATVDNFPETLTDGVCAYVRNGVVTSAEGYTLNINGTGALPVYGTMSAATRTSTLFNVNYTLLFIYNSSRVTGGCWDAYYGYYSNTDNIGYQIRTNSMSMPVSGATYRYRLLFTSADGTKFVPANTSTSTSATAKKTVNSTPIDPFGHICYFGSSGSVSSGSRPTATYLWEQYTITLGYSFNRTGSALTMTSWKPVYVKCTPQSDGSAIIDPDTPFVQALPSTKDGKIYIFLGIAYSATAIELFINHPVYYHNGTGIRQFVSPELMNVDTVPTENSTNFITSGAVYAALHGA